MNEKANLMNDTRIKACISRYDNGVYTRIEHTVMRRSLQHSCVRDANCNYDDDDATDAGDDEFDSLAAGHPQNDVCQVC